MNNLYDDGERGTFARPGHLDRLEDVGGLLTAAQRRPEALENRCTCGHVLGNHRPVTGHPCASCSCGEYMPEAMTLAGTMRTALEHADLGARLYAIDETGDGWRLIVEVSAATHGDGRVSAHAVCDTLRGGEWSNWRPVLIDGVTREAAELSMRWVDEVSGDDAPREHVVRLETVIEGWT